MPELMIIDENGKKTTAKKTGGTAAKKPAAAAKKKTSNTTLKLSAAERKLVQNYRKCNVIEKEVISALTEKAAGDLLKDIGGGKILGQIAELLK